MKFKNTLKINAKNEKEAQNIYKLLKPEMQKSDRFSSKIEKLKNIVVINITAKDAVALRSVMNSYLRILSMKENVDALE